MFRFLQTWLIAGGLAILVNSAVLAQPDTWPREIDGPDGGTITLYQPQIDLWEDFVLLEFRVAAEFKLPGSDFAIPAALRLEAETTTDLERQTVTAHDLKLLGIDFPGTNERIAQSFRDRMEAYIDGKTQTVSIDTLLAFMETSGSIATLPTPAAPVENVVRPEKLMGPVPAILVSKTPAVLVRFDAEPIFADIKGTDLAFAVNTNWDVLHHKPSASFYLLVGDAWLKAPAANGPWTPAGKLPKAFYAIPEDANFKTIRDNLPGASLSKEEAPRVFTSYKPAELIVLDGAPTLDPIPGTNVSWVINTESDLFRSPADGDYYYLVSGRWFRAPGLQGPWASAGQDLPKGFAFIPTDHPTAHARVSVQGTPEAEEAVMLATLPQKAEVKREGTTVEVTYDGEPEFQKIEDTTVYYATNTSYDVFRVGLSYYTVYRGVWFVAATPQGVWRVSTSVPAAIYRIPPASPKYHVTHVYIYDSSPDVVVVGYTRGYTGIYVSNGVVVYGTGYYYPPYVYYSPYYTYPVYRSYPYSYGVGAYYNPHTGTYGRGGAAYGPYGAAGWGASYNPNTGTYARGVSAAGPYNAGRAGQAYNPRTDTYAASYQRSNAYASWGESVVSRGDEWVRTANYSDSRGSAAGIETSQGGLAGTVQTDQTTAYVGKDANNNIYAGKDGNVYRRSDDGWSSYSDGTWQSVDRSSAQQRSQDRQQPSGRDWSERSSRTFESLDRDYKSRERSYQRSRDRSSWQRGSNRSRFSSGGSRSRSFSRGGRRRR